MARAKELLEWLRIVEKNKEQVGTHSHRYDISPLDTVSPSLHAGHEHEAVIGG
jgi:hypothetical protein